MKKHPFLLAILGLCSICVLYVACSKSNNSSASFPSSKQSLSLMLTDGPGAYDHVYLDIKSIEVLVDTAINTRIHDNFPWFEIGRNRFRVDTSTLVWQTLDFNSGEYDLLTLRNGVDTALVTSNIPVGSIRLIRIDLGAKDSVVVDSVFYPLVISNPADSSIILQFNGNEFEQYRPHAYRMWLDFDVLKSIRLINGEYYLNPVINPFIPSMTGQIEGTISPFAAWPEMVMVYNATDTSYALPTPDGRFEVRGLSDGTYSLLVESLRQNVSTPFADTTINNLTISNANTIMVGNIVLHQ